MLVIITNTGFSVVRPLLETPQNLNLVRNGSFGSGMTNWQIFAAPSPSNMESNTSSGAFQFNKLPAPGEPNQALVFQQTGMSLPAGATIEARFELGNTSTARRRISVLILDSDFSDLQVCTFWVPSIQPPIPQLPPPPPQPYRMRTHTTKAWTNAAIYFYAASDGTDGGFNRVDNVSLTYNPALATDVTECVDPTTPEASGDADIPISSRMGTSKRQFWRPGQLSAH